MRDPQLVVTAEVIERQCERHMKMYRRRLDSGSPAVIVSETEALLAIWTGMAGKTWLQLTEAEERELVDALFAEDWEFVFDGDDDVWLAAEPPAEGKSA